MSQTSLEFLCEYLLGAYRFQIERMDKIRERISFISGFLLVLGAGFGSLLNNYSVSPVPFPPRDVVFIVSLLSSSILFMLSTGLTAYCLMKGFQYMATKSPDEFYSLYKEWEDYNSHPAVNPKADIRKELMGQLSQVYAKAATHNLRVNTQRSDLLVMAMRCAFASAIVAAVPAACLVVSKYDNPDKPVQVRIVNPVKVNLK